MDLLTIPLIFLYICFDLIFPHMNRKLLTILSIFLFFTLFIGIASATAPRASFTASTYSTTVYHAVTLYDKSSYVPTSWSWNVKNAAGTSVFTSTSQNPVWTPTAAGQYSVTLTATNIDGSNTLIKSNKYINVGTGTAYNNSGNDLNWLGDAYYLGDWAMPIGPYSVDPRNVWVDASNRMHCDVKQWSGTWYGGEAQLINEVKYGIIRWTVESSRMGNVDKNIDMGTFTYGDQPSDGYNELDFEICAWGATKANTMEWTVHHSNYDPAIDTLYSVSPFYAPTSAQPMVWQLDWQASRVIFSMWYANGTLCDTWTYTGYSPAYEASIEQMIWPLAAPSDGQPETFIVDDLKFSQAAPVADFDCNVVSGSAPLPVTFTDTSTNIPTSWAWNFGDGSTATTKNTTHTYSTAGTYVVTMTATNYYGSSTQTKVITVGGSSVTPTITWANPADITYGTALSSAQLNAVARYNGVTVPGTFVYTPGTGTVLAAGNGRTLSVAFTPTDTNAYNSANASVTIDVNPVTPVITWANPASIYKGTALSGTQLNAVASVPGTFVYDPVSGTIPALGANTLSTTFTPTDSTNYNTATKTVTLTVVDQTPVANFSANNSGGGVGTYVSFNDTSSNFPSSWLWNFGDGTTSTSQNTTHQYTTCGIFMVTLRATNSAGSNTVTKTNLITINPVAAFTATPTTGNIPQTVTFTSTSTGSPTSYAWSWGDGTANSSAQNPTHIYSVAGTYSPILTVASNGISNSLQRSNYITAGTPTPVAAFSGSPSSGTSPLSVQFTDQSSGGPTSWAWNFGDGNTSTSQNPTNIYKTGTTQTSYTVTLNVTNAAGSNAVTKSSYVTVNPSTPSPVANFSANVTKGLPPLNVQFSDSSTGSPNNWSWSFGDGTANSSIQNPVHTFSNVGLYTIIETARNSVGASSLQKINYINVTNSIVTPVSDFTSNTRFGFAPATVNYTDSSTGSPSTWDWNFGDGTTHGITQNPGHVYSRYGWYSVSLVASNQAGAGNRELKKGWVLVLPSM